MSRLVRLDEVLLHLPKPPLKPFSQCTLHKDDCLILCAGFEDRAIESLNKISAAEGFDVLLVSYLPLVRENRKELVTARLRELGGRVEELVYDRENPEGFGKQVLDRLSSVHGRIAVDISAMSRLLIVQLLVVLRQQPGALERAVVMYTEAKEYPPTEKEVASLLEERQANPALLIHLLSSGVFEITVVPELSALSMAGEQTRLVAFPSFNADQLTALRAELQPSRLILVHGVPPDSRNSWRKDAIKMLNNAGDLGAEEYETSTLDYRKTLELLLDIYGKHNERDRIVVCPTGSKMQAVAVGLFRAFLDDIQIVYPTPKQFFPESYTTGVGPGYVLDLAFFSPVK
jgi:hypothetical protein